MVTDQIKFWKGNFGKEYTDRKTYEFEEWDASYELKYGTRRLKMNEIFLKDVPKTARILEVGCNIGMQLHGLKSQGFTNLYGLELQWYAVEIARKNLPGVNIIQGSAFDLPFKDGYFDIVCTNGVLIHISPDDLPKAFDEMYRCSKQYIWGLEYFNDEMKEIDYRGNKGFLWKADYGNLILERFPDMNLIKREAYDYIKPTEIGNTDVMYLLSK